MANKKISSYKKLKQENEILRNDIYNLVRHPDKEEGIRARARYLIIYGLEESVMFGNIISLVNKPPTGLLNLIK